MLQISDKLTLLVGFDMKSREIVVAVGKGGFEDFKVKDKISLPAEAARRTPAFLQDFLTSWDTFQSSENIRQILEMGEATQGIGMDTGAAKQGETGTSAGAKFEGRCEICDKKVGTESATGWFKLYREGRIIWICPDHDTRETFIFAQER